MTDPFYKSPTWQRLRKAALRRDRGRCVVPGCGRAAVVVDHIKRRRDGGDDALDNLRSLCREHDNAIKERASGKRAHGGKLFVRGCDVNGIPIDPGHAWNERR